MISLVYPATELPKEPVNKNTVGKLLLAARLIAPDKRHSRLCSRAFALIKTKASNTVRGRKPWQDAEDMICER
jgi:hypothetical protein